LWHHTRADLEELTALVSDEGTRPILGPEEPTIVSQWQRLLRTAGAWSLYGYGGLAIRLKGERPIVGTCGIFPSWREEPAIIADMPEAGWITHHDFTGRGIAGEAMAGVLAWFDTAHGPQRTVCMIEQGNQPSERLAARLGYRQFDTCVFSKDGTTLILYERMP
jgi:RimJ/RimL family protein N-acetyltransferase